jgi:hypothetical protein
MNYYQTFWMTWLLVGFAVEIHAILHKVDGGTLSEQVWSMRGTGFFSLTIAVLIWAIYHFIFEGRD